MKILIFGNAQYKDILSKKLIIKGQTCDNNIIGIDNLDTAKDFLLKHVVGGTVNQHIDLIIADDFIHGNRYQSNLCEWIRKNDEAFSGNNFRLSSIPIILCKAGISQTDVENSLYDSILPFSEDERDFRIAAASENLVRNWRKEIISDLSTLEIDPKLLEAFGSNFKETFKHYSKFANGAEYYFIRTKILSKDFIKNPRFLDYLWISETKLHNLEQALGKYQDIVRDLETYNRKAFERTVLHGFYNQNKPFLLRDVYGAQLYERRYKVSTVSAYHIPDYTLRAAFPGFTTTSVSEIKRHNVHFEYDPKRHENFTKYSQKALNQAINYQYDFETAGSFEKQFQMDLIIGLDDRRTEFVKRNLSRQYSMINVITHDQLLAIVDDYYKQLRNLHATIRE